MPEVENILDKMCPSLGTKIDSKRGQTSVLSMLFKVRLHCELVSA